MAIKPYLQLVRLPNLFTAAADPLAGWLLLGGRLDEPRRWVPLVAASVLIYAGGIVLNDVADYAVDLRERPGRPLPSGRVSRRLAAAFVVATLVLGVLSAFGSGSTRSGWVALGLVAAVLGYDLGLKRTPIGPIVMGSCRGLSFLLGMSPFLPEAQAAGLLVPVALTIFVAGVTWISRSEVETGRTRGLVAGLSLENLALLVLIVARDWRNSPPEHIAAGVTVLLLVGRVLNQAGLAAYREPVPATFQRAVKTGVLSLVWLDVAVVAGSRGLGPALVVALLWVPAFVIARWLYTT